MPKADGVSQRAGAVPQDEHRARDRSDQFRERCSRAITSPRPLRRSHRPPKAAGGRPEHAQEGAPAGALVMAGNEGSGRNLHERRTVCPAGVLPRLAEHPHRGRSGAKSGHASPRAPYPGPTPARPSSAMATAIVALWTSMPTNAMLPIRPAPHTGGSAPANPAQPSRGGCSRAGCPSQAANIEFRPPRPPASCRAPRDSSCGSGGRSAR